MFERWLHHRFAVFAIWLCVTSVAAAQSNHPIEIGASAKPVGGADPWPDVPGPGEGPVRERLHQIAHKVVAAPPTAPVSPSSPVVPQPSPSSVAALQQGNSDHRPPMLAMPSERQALGRPRGNGDPTTEPVRIAGTGWVLNTVVALGIVIAVIFLLRGVLGRLMGRSGGMINSPVLEVLGRVSVAPRHDVLMIRTGKRVLVVGDGASGLRTLADIDDPDEVAGLLAAAVSQQPDSVARGFGHLLARFNRDYGDDVRRIEEGHDVAEIRVDRARDQVSNVLARIRHLASSQWGSRR